MVSRNALMWRFFFSATRMPNTAFCFILTYPKAGETYEEQTKHDLDRERGGTGGDGFYISGNAQFSGFFYPDEMKGEKGEVSFPFKNDAGEERTCKKEMTLK